MSGGSRKTALKRGIECENDFRKGLERRGYIVDKAERSLRDIPKHKPAQFCPTCHKMDAFRISKKHDTFGMFDMTAKHKEFPDYTFYFQVKKGRWVSGAERRAIEAFPRGQFDVICMVRKMDRTPFELKYLGESSFVEGEPAWIEYDAADFIDQKKFIKKQEAQ